MNLSGLADQILRRALRLMPVFGLATALAGCVTKSKADMQARMAYMAGRRDAYMEVQDQRSRGPSVSFLGPVTNHVVRWTPGLSLSQGILKSGYTGPQDPKTIVIHRNGENIQVDPKQLLAGQDVPLEIGDLVELQD